MIPSVCLDSASSSSSETPQLSHLPTPANEKKESYFSPYMWDKLQSLKNVWWPPTGKTNTLQILEIKKLLMSRQDEINVLHEELRELSRVSTKAINSIDSVITHDDEALWGRIFKPDNKLSKIIEQYQDKLQQFVKSRLSEIVHPNYSTHFINRVTKKYGGTKELPEDIANLIAQKIKQNFGESLVDELKRALVANLDNQIGNLLDEIDIISPSFWTYIFKSWDFLIKYQALKPETAGNFFQGPFLIRLLVRYARIFAGDAQAHTGSMHYLHSRGPIQFLDSYHLTDHWYWKLSHGCLRNLHQVAESTINADFLLWSRREALVYWTKNSEDPLNFHRITEKFQVWYGLYNYFVEVVRKGTIEPTDLSNHLNEIIELVVSTDPQMLISPNQLLRGHVIAYYCDFLQYFDEHLEPGMLRELLKTNPNSEKFDKRFKLIKISAGLLSLNYRATHFYEKHVRKIVGWETSSMLQSTFNDHLNQFDILFKQLQLESNRICNKQYQDDTCDESGTLIARFVQDRAGIKQKSSSFSVSKN